MSAKLIQNPDGADFQAQAVLAYVRYLIASGIDQSWNDEQKRYLAEPEFNRFDNCREQGYTIFLRSADYARQINVTFYEHRNSDNIIIRVNEERTFNAPTLEDVLKTSSSKSDYEKEFGAGKPYEAADYIVKRLTAWWTEKGAAKPVAKKSQK